MLVVVAIFAVAVLAKRAMVVVVYGVVEGILVGGSTWGQVVLSFLVVADDHDDFLAATVLGGSKRLLAD